MPDKAKELNTTVELINNKLHFNGTAGNNTPVSIDYFPPLGDDLGYTSLELLLLSLSSCVGSAVITFLRKMNKEITGFKIISKGIRKEEHPTGFKSITLNILITAPDTSSDDMDKVIQLTEDKYCPVWSMLKGNVELFINYQIVF
ncbi:MAG: OsmC family protein [Bacteroidota bacterium]